MDRRLRNSHLAASGGLTRIDDWFFSKRTRHTLPTTLHTSPDTALSRLFQSALLSARLANCPLHFTASCKSTARPEDNLFRGGAREMRQMNLNAKFGKTPKIQANATVKLTLLPTWTLRLFSAFSARLRVKSARRHWRRRFSSVFPTSGDFSCATQISQAELHHSRKARLCFLGRARERSGDFELANFHCGNSLRRTREKENRGNAGLQLNSRLDCEQGGDNSHRERSHNLPRRRQLFDRRHRAKRQQTSSAGSNDATRWSAIGT